MKRILCILLALILLSSLTLTVFSASEASASTMHLTETKGSVAVKNAVGKTLKNRDGMRLHNGYDISTEKASYAYINLDSSKAVKLDASSTAEVSRSGRKLELNLTEGSLFFNVPVALDSDESLDIRTSTMVAGIRGTSGWVRILDRYTTQIGLLEGKLTICSFDPLTGETRYVTIIGGQICTIIRHEHAAAMEDALIEQGEIIEPNIIDELTKLGQVVEDLEEENVPGFVAVEVAADTALQAAILEKSPLDPALIAQNADKKLAADEAADTAAPDEDSDDSSIVSEPLFAEPETIVVTETVYVEVPGETIYVPGETIYLPGETEYVTLDLDNPTADELNQALETLDVAAVTNANLDLSDLVIPAGKTLYIVSGTLNNTGDDTSILGTVMMLPGTTLNNSGTLSINSTNSLHISGTMTNEAGATLHIGGTDGAGKLVVESSGVLTNKGTVTVNASDGSSFLLNGAYQDTVNEVMIQNSSNEISFLGTFDAALTKVTDGNRIAKLLSKGTLSINSTITATATLDLNGNDATVSGGLLSVNGDLTLTDSVGGGELTGYVDIGEDGHFTMAGGALVVPEGKVGITSHSRNTDDAEYNFTMTGGVIDARNSRYALDLTYSEYTTNEYLSGGYLLGRPTPYGVYYHSMEYGEGVSFVRAGSIDPELLDYDTAYNDAYEDTYSDAYRTGFRNGFDDGYTNATDKPRYDSYYDDGEGIRYDENGSDGATGNSDGLHDGRKVGYRYGYSNGFERGNDRFGTGSYTDGFDAGFDAANAFPSSDFYGDQSFTFRVFVYEIDTRVYGAGYFEAVSGYYVNGVFYTSYQALCDAVGQEDADAILESGEDATEGAVNLYNAVYAAEA